MMNDYSCTTENMLTSSPKRTCKSHLIHSWVMVISLLNPSLKILITTTVLISSTHHVVIAGADHLLFHYPVQILFVLSKHLRLSWFPAS